VKQLRALPPQVAVVVGLVFGVILLVLVGRGARAIDSSLKTRRASDRVPMMRFVRRTGEEGQIYLVPTHMAEFRLETGVPVVVTFKSHPYKDVEVIEWQERVLAVNDFYTQPTCDKLQGMMARYAVTHVVMESGQLAEGCGFGVEAYRDDRYVVYRLRESS
jgi:uncharacterized membrane protein